MDWKSYNSCCHSSALEPAAAFCTDCGTPLMRCVAFSECRSLVRPHRYCEVCVALELSVDRGAVTAATVGQRLSIPLVLRNKAAVERPVWVKKIEMRLGANPFQDVPLMWERIDRHEERRFNIETGALEAGGTGTITVAVTVASRYKGYEECYVLGGDVRFKVEAASDGKVIQNIDFSGAILTEGSLVNTRLDAANEHSAGLEAAQERVEIKIEPAERHEIEHGVRGYTASGYRVPRNVEFKLVGFPEGHAPAGTTRIGSSGVLVFGRNLRTADAADNPDPSDVTLRVWDHSAGQIDRDASFAVSRRHFDILVLNERLYLHVRSGNGLSLNGEAVPTAHVQALHDGDTIAPIQAHPDLLALTVRLSARHGGIVDKVQIVREK